MTVRIFNIVMERYRHIEHNSGKHIDTYVIPIAIGTMFLSAYVVQKTIWLLHLDSLKILKETTYDKFKSKW